MKSKSNSSKSREDKEISVSDFAHELRNKLHAQLSLFITECFESKDTTQQINRLLITIKLFLDELNDADQSTEIRTVDDDNLFTELESYIKQYQNLAILAQRSKNVEPAVSDSKFMDNLLELIEQNDRNKASKPVIKRLNIKPAQKPSSHERGAIAACLKFLLDCFMYIPLSLFICLEVIKRLSKRHTNAFFTSDNREESAFDNTADDTDTNLFP